MTPKNTPPPAGPPGPWTRLKRTARFVAAVALPLIAASGMLAYGVNGLQVAARYPRPVTLPYAQFVRRVPRSGWYRIPDAVVDLGAAVPRHTAGKSGGLWGYRTDGYYAPVYGPGGPKAGPTPLLLCVPDDSLPASAAVARPVEGLVETGLDQATPLGHDVAALGKALAPGYAVLDDGFHPQHGLSLALVVIGGPLTLLTLLGIGAVLFGGNRDADMDDVLDDGQPKRRRRAKISVK